jgi:beta-lactamase regulating signal transducer with metallopeptidase domain
MEILFNAFVKATGWSILNSLWQGALIYTVLLFLFTFNKGLDAKAKHNLSFMALSGMLCWFGTTFYSEFNSWIELNKGMELHYAEGLALTEHLTAPSRYMSFARKAEQSFPILVLLYSGGLLIQAAMLLFGYLKVRQLKTKGLSDLPELLRMQFTELSKQTGLSRMVKFSLSTKVNVPMVVGYFKPMVLIPLSILSHLDVQQLEAVIIHELSHIRRNDYLLNLVKICIETVLFFNPFVWFCVKLIETEREHACDDLVLKITGNPLEYALTLLDLEKMKQRDQEFVMAITGRRHYLLNRIKRITNAEASTACMKVQTFILIVAVSAMLLLAWSPVKKIHNFREISATSTKPSEPVISHAIKTVNSTSLIVDRDAKKRRILNAIPENEKDSEDQVNNIYAAPEDIGTRLPEENLTDSKLTDAVQTKTFTSGLTHDSVKSIMWLNKEGKIIAADPKIIYYSKTLSGYTIDKDGNILDGHRKLLDRLAGGKPIIKVDSTGEMSRYYSNVTGFPSKGNVQTTTNKNSRSTGLTTARTVPEHLPNSDYTVNALTSSGKLSTAKTLTGSSTGDSPKTLSPNTTTIIRGSEGPDPISILKQKNNRNKNPALVPPNE